MIILLPLIFLFLAAVSDMRYYKIPNYLVLLLIITGIISMITLHNITEKLIGLFFPSIILLFPYSKSKIGAGDIKLVSSLGLIYGYKLNTILFLLSIFIALIFNRIFYLIKKQSPNPGTLPLAPFVFVSYMVSVLLRIIFN